MFSGSFGSATTIMGCWSIEEYEWEQDPELDLSFFFFFFVVSVVLTPISWTEYLIFGLASWLGCQKLSKSDFQSEFSMSRIIWIFLIFFIEEYLFRTKFFVRIFSYNFNFWITLLLKSCPIFDGLSSDGFTKFGHFIWLQLIFSQKSCLLGPSKLSD